MEIRGNGGVLLLTSAVVGDSALLVGLVNNRTTGHVARGTTVCITTSRAVVARAPLDSGWDRAVRCVTTLGGAALRKASTTRIVYDSILSIDSNQLDSKQLTRGGVVDVGIAAVPISVALGGVDNVPTAR